MNTPDQLAIQWACQRTLTGYFLDLDAGRYEALAARFAADGVWHRQGKVLTGPAQILEIMQSRPASGITMHVLANVHVTVTSTDTAFSESYLTVYGFNNGEPIVKPVSIKAPLRVGHCDTRFSRVGDQWLIAEHALHPDFSFVA